MKIRQHKGNLVRIRYRADGWDKDHSGKNEWNCERVGIVDECYENHLILSITGLIEGDIKTVGIRYVNIDSITELKN